MRQLLSGMVLLGIMTLRNSVLSGGVEDVPASSRARQFLSEHEAKVRPLEKAVSLAWWQANISGKDEDFKAKEEIGRASCRERV